ncbi:histidine phosphatase family protein [Streptococcus pluranimalium]|uniref:histidine phosphatase family protein n=1 Tax=Streptococcus pluranimalium TaxID=82348 RepID=UPI0039FC9653
MTQIYLMRHGQTLFNVMDINQGHCDSQLTASGIAQAKRAKEWFVSQGIRFDKVYTSSSERAMDTTELVTDLPYDKLKGLKEINLGTKEASPNSENPTYPYGDYFVKYGGESLEGFTTRFYETMLKIAQEAGDQTVLVVSHGMAIKRFFTAIAHDHQDALLGNCAIVDLTYQDGQFQVNHIINPNA